jgi:CRISPR-associated protein Csd1
MSWIHRLYETYEQCASNWDFLNDKVPLLPISHVAQQAHVEIVIDSLGNFLRASSVSKELTILPATEKSMTGRTSGVAPYPLCEKVQYCAGDYSLYGGLKKSHFPAYSELLESWCISKFSHPKAKAVFAYISKRAVVADLIGEHVLHLDNEGHLLTEWTAGTFPPDIFKHLTPKEGLRDQGDALVRWRVETPGDAFPGTWQDPTLMDAWIKFETSKEGANGLCMVTGEEITLARLHPGKLRHSGDGAKLISSNDTTGFTYLGRFTDTKADNAKQACTVGAEVSQKAHNALRWLIGRQAYRNGGQAVLAWAVSGKRIPDPLANSFDLFMTEAAELELGPRLIYEGDTGQALGQRLVKMLRGYQAKLGSSNEIVVMGLDSATDGRIAITFYRELTGSEFLERLLVWHEDHAWHQNYSKDITFIGAPAPKDIAEAAFGRRLDEKLRKATVERLLPCIMDGRKIPRDLVESTVRRASNRSGLKYWEWEKYLGIACALFRGYHRERGYQMALELNRTSRDYLYGRLLAIAENIEGRALNISGENRETSAGKLLQRFADHPFSTWKIIELSLTPYKTRLRGKRPAFLAAMETQLDNIVNLFQADEFMQDRRLSGEFLLGYHCQRQVLRTKPKTDQDENTEIADAENN